MFARGLTLLGLLELQKHNRVEGLLSQTIFVRVQLERESSFLLLLLFPHTQVLQEFHQQLFVQKNPAFQPAPDFMFQPADSDTVNPGIVMNVKHMTQHTSAFPEHERCLYVHLPVTVKSWSRGGVALPLHRSLRLLLTSSRAGH